MDPVSPVAALAVFAVGILCGSIGAMLGIGGAVFLVPFLVLVMGLSFLYGFAVGTSLTVAIAVAAAITLLPALLGFAGPNINRFHIGRRAPRSDRNLFARWARVVQRRPAPIALAGFAVLLITALPS